MFSGLIVQRHTAQDAMWEDLQSSPQQKMACIGRFHPQIQLLKNTYQHSYVVEECNHPFSEIKLALFLSLFSYNVFQSCKNSSFFYFHFCTFQFESIHISEVDF